MTGTHTHTRWRHRANWLIVGVLVLAGIQAGLAPAVAQTADQSPEVDVTTDTADGNLTLSIRGANITEIDVTNVPDDWSVVTRRDDFGTYRNQLESRDRMVWLWSGTVSANVSVTFALPEDTDLAYDVSVVPYSGTTRGESVNVTSDDGDSESSGSDGPGFGVFTALLAVLLLAGTRHFRP